MGSWREIVCGFEGSREVALVWRLWRVRQARLCFWRLTSTLLSLNLQTIIPALPNYSPRAHCQSASVLISSVAPGLSPACAALKGGATSKLGHYRQGHCSERALWSCRVYLLLRCRAIFAYREAEGNKLCAARITANSHPTPCEVEESQGRRYAEPPHPYRNEYERDRDRIFHARAFRRLENKTQVFTRRYSDHFRNRLTHTLEVAQISRTVAKALGLNTDLVEALALVHDVGHPPGGHSGESELDRLMRRHHDAFGHNLHALRIVESFEQKYAAFPGLNLTFEVREGIIKHSRDYPSRRLPGTRRNTAWMSGRRSKRSSSTSPTRLPTTAPISTTATKPNFSPCR